MRLFASALGIIAGFGVGVWAIAQIVADRTSQWVGVTLSMVLLFVLIFIALLTGTKQRVKREDQRRLFGYSLLAAVLMAAFLVPVFLYHLNVPKLAAQAILGAIGVGVFFLSEYMVSRKIRRANR